MQPSIQKLQLVSYSYNMNSQLSNYNKACKYTCNSIICDWLWENPPVTHKDNFKQFNILNYLKLSACNTRSSNIKLLHTRSSNNTSRHFYFNRLPQLWNALPPSISTFQLTLSRIKSCHSYGTIFYIILTSIIFVLVISYAHVIPVC